MAERKTALRTEHVVLAITWANTITLFTVLFFALFRQCTMFDLFRQCTVLFCISNFPDKFLIIHMPQKSRKKCTFLELLMTYALERIETFKYCVVQTLSLTPCPLCVPVFTAKKVHCSVTVGDL